MVLGMSLATFTAVHTIISLIGIVSGLIVMYGMLTAKRMDGMTAIFLASSVLTSVTGFLFPYVHWSPGDTLGVLSLIVLAFAVPARYAFGMAGAWRAVYVVTSTIALYFNMFVLVVQTFEKVPAVHALAPTQKEPPFAIAQGTLLVIFIILGILATRKFRLASALPTVVKRAA